MKSFKLVFILALLACFVAATALAGVAGGVKGANTVQGQGRASAVYDKTASDIPADRAQKFSAPIRVDAALASPQPEQINAMALLKYPTVSAAGLSGTYTIPGDFPDLVSAAAVLNFVGLSGDATFELTSTSYASGTVNIGGAYPGAGTYSLTITVTLGNDVTYDFTTTATNGKGIVLNGAKNVTIDGVGDDTTSLTLAIASYAPFPLGDAFGSTIYITGGSDEIAVKNATVSGVVNDPVWEDQTEGRSCVFIWADDADPGANTDLEFDNVTMINGTIGIKGFAGDFYNSVEGLTVNDCNFGGAFGGRLIIGSWIEWSANVTWTNNEFKDLYWLDWYWNNVGTEYVEDNVFGVGNIYYNLGQMTAWHHLVVANGTYAYNVVDGLSGDVSAGTISYGTRTLGASTATAPVLHHNRFQNIFLDHAGQSLVVIRGGAINVHHNSVRLTGTKTISTTWTSNCLNGVVAAYNNAFSNEMLGGLASTRRGVQAGGTIDYNAIYSSGYPAVGQSTIGAAVAAGINTNGLYGPVNFSADLHIDTATVSAAREIGKPGVLLANDIDGTPIDTTIAGKRDAGADQFSPLSAILTADVLPAAITNPPASGIPTGVPQIPVVRVKNNSQTGATFSVSLTIAPDGYSDTKPITLGPNAVGNVSFASWTPVGAGPRTVTATTLLGGDTNPANDIISRAQPVSATVVPPPVYTFDASAEGWEATTGPGAVTDWKRKTSFSKLGGVYGGAGASWVTERPDNPATYTEAGNANAHGYASTFPGPNLLTTPWLDLSGMAGTDLYISFSHSIETEPLWDRAWLQYTVDGITWTDLGVLNDPNGINWYDESLYEHAALDPDNWDDGTAQTYGVGNASNPAASWTSNDNGTTGSPGNTVPTGPSGYVYVQLKITTTSHPTAARSPNIRFRYVAFSDGSVAFGGWAFDNFALSPTVPSFPGGTIAGHAWNDANGNGVDDGEADITATKVYVSLLGSLIDSVLTSGTGDYSWSGVTLPAAYEIKLNVAGVAFTVPFGISNAVNVNHLADSSTKTQDFGTFAGSVSGKKFSDVNDNGVNDSEPGVAGWTIQIHRDSLTGLLMGSDVSDGSGDYSLLLPAYAGSYVANEVAQPLVGRRTFPAGAGTHTFSVNVGTPNVTGKDFGNFLYGRIRVQLTVDQNGNGVRDAGDIIAVPSGSTSSFNVKQNGAHLPGSPFTLGGGSIGSTFTGLDTGTYVVSEVDSIPGWRRTKGGVDSVVVSTSGLNDTSDYLDFKYLVITGNKFNDLDGDGVKDGGEPGLEGWTINVTGGVYYGGASAATDTNGDYSIDSVFTGSHVVSEVVQAGWTRTMPGGAGTYAIAGISGNLINTTGKDFGNFDNSDVSGIVYRDYNGNGVMDGSDAAMSGVTVDLAVNGGSDVSDGSGYSFNGVIAVDTVRITVPGGFTISQPAAGEYPVALISGGAATLRHFGLFQTTDSSTKYRTFTAAQLGADDQKKPGKRPKAGKAYDPVKNKPNSANLVDDLIGKTGQAIGSIRVGLAGQLNVAGKTKAYVQPNKQSALWGSLNNKSLHHTGMARGFDLDIKGKPFLKLQKSFGPNKKQNNKLFGELLALKLNLVASGLKTPAGLGVLIYSDPLSDYDGMTVDEIADTADVVMTNYEFVPLGVYAGLDTVVAKINAAFYNAATDDTSAGWAAPKLQWRAYTSVDEVSYLKPNPGATPKNRRVETVEAVPTAFALEQNYPNPFNPTTTIEFDLPEASIVTLKVYNLLGQEVATLFDREEIELNETVEFDASSLPSGVYLYRIVAETIADAEEGVASETFTQVKKMVLVK